MSEEILMNLARHQMISPPTFFSKIAKVSTASTGNLTTTIPFLERTGKHKSAKGNPYLIETVLDGQMENSK